MASKYKVPMTSPDGKFGMKIRVPTYVYDAFEELARRGILGDTAEDVASHVLRQGLFEQLAVPQISAIVNYVRTKEAVVKEVVYPVPTTRPRVKRHGSTPNKKSTQRRKPEFYKRGSK